MDQFNRLKAIQEKKAQEAKEQSLATKQEIAQLKSNELIVQVAKSVVDFISGHTTKTVVLNQLEDFATSQNVKELVQSITSLHDTLKTHENTNIEPLAEVMTSVLEQVKLIPKDLPEEKEQKFVDYTEQIKSLTEAVKLVEESVKAQKLNVEAPVVNVDAPVVNVEAQDLKPLAKELEKAFIKAVGGIPTPEAIDLKPLVDEQKKSNKLLKDIRDMPMGGGGGGGSTSIAPFLVDGKLPVQATSTDYDKQFSYTATTDIIAYQLDAVTVKTKTVTYTDATKAVVDSVVWS